MTSLTITSTMECQSKTHNSNKLVIHEMSEKLKHRSHSKMCLAPSNQDQHSDISETQDSEANLDKSKQCNSLTPTNKSRFKNLFKSRETKQALKLHKTNRADPRSKEHSSDDNLYYVPAGDDNGNPPTGTSRCVEDESDIYEEVSEPQIPSGRPLDKTSSMEKKETHQAGSVFQNMTVRPLSPGSRKIKKPYVDFNLPDDDIETDSDASSWDHTYDSVSQDDEQTGTNCNLNPIASSLCEAERVHHNVQEPVRKPLHADSGVSKKPPPVLPKAACIKRSSSKRIHQEWCKLNGSTTQLDRPVPAHRRPKELPEIEEELKVWRELLKQQKDVDITKIVISNVNFTGRMVDSRGGRLQLTSHGVSLYIPPGALGDEPQEIFIYVQQNLKSSLDTLKGGFISPIVHCGTSGLKFNNPVILTFPVHVKDASRWELTGVRQDSSTKPWADISNSSSDTMLLNDNLCTVVVDHFTGFGAVGRPNQSQASRVLPLRVKVYNSQTNAIDPVKGSVELRVYIFDESSETCELIKNREKDSKLLVDKSPGFYLHISDRGSRNSDLDVTFELECLNELWKTSFRKQVFSLSRSEVNDPVIEYCTLNIRPQDAAMGSEHRPLECEISICQSSYEELGVTVRAVDHIGVQSGRESTGHRGMSVDIRLNDFDPMSLGRYRKLSEYLDSERRWRLLVKPCFIGKEAEQNFDKCGHPSAVVLGIIFSQGSRESSMTTLVRLRSILNECQLTRAAQIVHKDINDLEESYSGKDKGGIFVHPVQCSDDLDSQSDEAKLHCSAQTPEEDLYEAIDVPSDARNCLPDGQHDVRPSYRRHNRIAEENDECPDQIHTLQSNQFIPRNTDRSFHVQRQKPEPTQDNWPPENLQEVKDPSYAYCPQIFDDCSVPQFNNNYQNLAKKNAKSDTSGYVYSLGNKNQSK